ncbi:hypothetical protein JHK82_044034 [Glycine max]|nr:hypothetical protein JHK82_044034 [Glycine max]
MFQGLGCSPIKAVRELGSERRETVRSISGVGVRALRGPFPSTRGPGRTHLWCASYRAHGVEEPHQSIPNLVVKLYCGTIPQGRWMVSSTPRTPEYRTMNEERHEIKANILAIHCEALILDWRGHQRPLPFHPLDR